jgi:hypothetical protein
MWQAMVLAAGGLVFVPAAPAAVAADDPVETIYLEGTVTNLSVGKTAKVRFRITVDGKSLRAKGGYDNKNLFGTFDVPGRVIHKTDDTVSMQFSGDLEFGGDGSGAAPGTKMAYAMTLLISENKVRGVYRITPRVFASPEEEQYGTMDLKVVKK